MHRHAYGFTLIELLIASSLFVLVVGLGMSLWGSITRIQRANLNSQKVFSESRFWVDRIAAETQGGKIFYNNDPSSAFYPYPKPVNPQPDGLIVTTNDGTSIRYYIDSFSGALYKEEIESGDPSVVLSSPEIRITRFAVHVTPTFKDETRAPRVTMFWQARDLNLSDPQTMNMQTTIGLRNY